MNKKHTVLSLVFAVLVGWAPPSSAVSTGPLTLKFIDVNGQPIRAGFAFWAVGQTHASQGLPIASDGTITFPYAPYVAGKVGIFEGLTSKGNHAYEKWDITFDSSVHELQLTSDPTPETRRVRVALPNGVGVPGAEVRMTYHWADTVPQSGIHSDGELCPLPIGRSYTCVPDVTGVTRTKSVPFSNLAYSDNNGYATFRGFTYDAASPEGRVWYDDGIMSQMLDFTGTSDDPQTIQLDYMPWIEVDSATYSARVNALVDINVTTHEPVASPARAALSGVRVSVVPPLGSKQRCRNRVLSTTTTTTGTARLRVCATKSGEYKLLTSGAVSVGSVMLRVRKAAPMAPASVGAVSLLTGRATVSWAPPPYAGGARVLRYVVVATSGRNRVTYVVRKRSQVSSRLVTLRGLASNRVWRISVTATTKYGTSDSAKTSVIVK